MQREIGRQTENKKERESYMKKDTPIFSSKIRERETKQYEVRERARDKERGIEIEKEGEKEGERSL